MSNARRHQVVGLLTIAAACSFVGCEQSDCPPGHDCDGIGDFSQTSTETEVVFRFHGDLTGTSTYKVATYYIFESPVGGPIVDVRDAVPIGDGMFEATFQWCEIAYANAWAVVQEYGAGFTTLTSWQPIEGPLPTGDCAMEIRNEEATP